MKSYKVPFKYKWVWHPEMKKYVVEFTTKQEQQNMTDAKALLRKARTLYQECYDYCAANRINLEQYFEVNPTTALDIQNYALAAQELVKGVIEYNIDKYMVAPQVIDFNEEEK